jgi:hypothetical protein
MHIPIQPFLKVRRWWPSPLSWISIPHIAHKLSDEISPVRKVCLQFSSTLLLI